MKWIIVLTTCFTASIISVHGQLDHCDLGTACNVIPEKLNGLWYISYASSEEWQEYENCSITLQLRGNEYDIALEGIFPSTFGKMHIFNGTWIINDDDTIFVNYYVLPGYNSKYRIQATDNESFFILQGCLPCLKGKKHTTVWLRERCPSEETLDKVEEALEKLHLNLNNFYEDPIIKQSCEKN